MIGAAGCEGAVGNKAVLSVHGSTPAAVTGRRWCWSAEASMTERRARRSSRRWPTRSRWPTTRDAAAERAATRRRTHWNARSRTSPRWSTSSGAMRAFGASSGGALLLEAAAAGLPLDRIAVWEVPYAVGGEAVAGCQDYSAALREALARGDRDVPSSCSCGWPDPPGEGGAGQGVRAAYHARARTQPRLRRDVPRRRPATGGSPGQDLPTHIGVTGPGGEEAMQEMAIAFIGQLSGRDRGRNARPHTASTHRGWPRGRPAVLGPVLTNWFAT